jgi:hypothetical protein
MSTSSRTTPWARHPSAFPQGRGLLGAAGRRVDSTQSLPTVEDQRSQQRAISFAVDKAVERRHRAATQRLAAVRPAFGSQARRRYLETEATLSPGDRA